MLTGETVTRGYLTAGEAVAIFKRGLDDELGLATAGQFDAAGDDDVERTARVMGAAYRIAARLDPDVEALPADLLVAHTGGFADADRRAVVLMLKALAPQRAARVDATMALAAIGAPITPTTIRDARVQILLAKAEAQDRAALIAHPDAVLTGDPVARLLDDAVVVAMRAAPRTVSPDICATPVPDSPPLGRHTPLQRGDRGNHRRYPDFGGLERRHGAAQTRDGGFRVDHRR
jgi:hypothetical protein